MVVVVVEGNNRNEGRRRREFRIEEEMAQEGI